MDFLKTLGIEPINSGGCWSATNWTPIEGQSLIESYNPTTSELIAKVTVNTPQEYERIISQAEKSSLIWRSIPAPLRGELVRKIGQALRAKKSALGSLVAFEMGKIKAEGDGEVQEMIDMADFAVGQSRMLYGKTMHSERPEHRMYEQWHPLGIIGVISAFNFPVAVWSWNAFIAAICGNVTVWKASPKTPLCAVAVQKICNQVMEDSGYPPIFFLFTDDNNNQLTQSFIEDSRIKKISFTGSSVVGKLVGVKVAERMGKSLLELSGNNALILDQSADMKLAIPAITFGAVGTAGQRCTTTRRLIVHEQLLDKTLDALKAAYSSVKIGDPLAPTTLMGPLIDETAVLNFEEAVNKAEKSGGQVICGGQRVAGAGNFVEPTIIRAKNNWEVVQSETFAPILYVMTFTHIDEAISIQNDAKQGLSSAIFTNDIKNAEKFLSSVGSDCGIANVNIGTSGAEIGGAFGGEKQTGGGREAGSDAWKAYMRRQTNTIFWGETPTLAQGITFDLD